MVATETEWNKLKLKKVGEGAWKANTPDGRKTVKVAEVGFCQVLTYYKDGKLMVYPIPQKYLREFRPQGLPKRL